MVCKRLILILILVFLAVPGTLLAQDDPTPNFPFPPGRLIVGDDTGLYAMLADRSEKTYLVEESEAGCWLRDGVLSPDGALLLYTRICGGQSPTDWHSTGRTAAVYILDLDSGTSSELVPNDGSYQDYAGDWHPDGERVVIYSNRVNDRYDFYEVSIADGETTQISDFESDAGRVSWDPSGRYLLYNRYMIDTDTIRWEVRALDSTTGDEIPVAVGVTPHWSPDGEWIAYVTDEGETDVFVKPAECIYAGTDCSAEEATNITYTPDVAEREPLWSPDQTQITYLRDTAPEPAIVSWDIYRQDLRTGMLAQLTATSDMSERQSQWERVETEEMANLEDTLPIVMRITSATANLRAQPTTNSEIVGVLNRDQLIFVQGANPARDWYFITLPEDGSQAWVFGDLVTPVAGDAATAPEIEVEEE